MRPTKLQMSPTRFKLNSDPTQNQQIANGATLKIELKNLKNSKKIIFLKIINLAKVKYQMVVWMVNILLIWTVSTEKPLIWKLQIH